MRQFTMLVVGLVGFAALVAGVLGLVGLLSDPGGATVVHEIAVACYFILFVVAVHCGHYLGSLAAADEPDED